MYFDFYDYEVNVTIISLSDLLICSFLLFGVSKFTIISF